MSYLKTQNINTSIHSFSITGTRVCWGLSQLSRGDKTPVYCNPTLTPICIGCLWTVVGSQSTKRELSLMLWEHVNSTLKSPWWVILGKALGPQDLDAADTKNHQQAYTVVNTQKHSKNDPNQNLYMYVLRRVYLCLETFEIKPGNTQTRNIFL